MTGDGGWRPGTLTGLAGTVRLAGLAVGAVALAGLVFYHRRRLGTVPTSSVWLAGLAGLVVLLLLQPYLVTDWELLLQTRSASDFNYAMKVAQGEFLMPWSLVDVHTIPYLHHWTHLWPMGVGWPLTVAFCLGIVYGAWKGDRRKGLLLLWAGIHFALIGGLLTKPIRYLLPMLPFLAILTADFCVWLVHSPRLLRVRKLVIAATAAVLVYSASYGIAFAGIYAREDSRIEAARWIDERIPANSRIGVERGAFSMKAMIDDDAQDVRVLRTNMLFDMRGYATCRAEVNWLQHRLRDLDYIAIMDVNRYRQFTAVPELIPGGAAFYQALVDEELGFDLVHRIKRYPSLGGLEFRDDGTDPSFTGYDHPMVMIFRKRDDAAWQEGLQGLRARLSTSVHCVDSFLEGAVSALEAGELNQSLIWTGMATRRLPQNSIAHLIEAHLLPRMGQSNQAASESYHADLRQDRTPAYPLLATGMSLLGLGLNNLAMSALETGVSATNEDERVPRELMALNYIRLAEHLKDDLELEEVARVLLLSTRIHPIPLAYNRLSGEALKRKDYERSAEYLKQSLQLDSNQAGVHATLCQVMAKMGDPAAARHHFKRALELNPDLEDRLSPWITVHRD